MSTVGNCPLPTLTASSDADLGEALADRVRAACAERRALRIVGGDTKAWYGRGTGGEVLDLSGHRGVVAYEPSELVITARAGTPVREIEALLAEHGQRLAFEPPVFGPASTIGGVVAAGLAGPRRPFAGAVRDFVLGVSILDGRGRRLRFGGTVFKNVAGFDAFRLMAGALGRLGVLLEVSLRVTPAPAARIALAFEADWPAARARLAALMRRPLPLAGACHDGERLHLRLYGAPAGVAAAARELGGEEAPLAFWDGVRHMTHGLLAAPRLWRLSVPQSAELAGLDGRWFHDWAGTQRWLATEEPADRVRALAAAAGGHATLFRGAKDGEVVFTPLAAPLLALHKRLAHAFDPHGVLNPGRMYEGL
jgi:glycolate oxidase FAD binding subunit